MEEGLVFPNECYICKSTGELKRCRCNFISYCGDDHQRQHWPVHEDFCNAIMSLLEEKRLTHIYEELFNIFGIDFDKKRIEFSRELIMKLKRPMSPLEQAMFLRPRVCYVCCKVEQEELTNCPGCPIASFCKLHQNDKTHKDNCEPMKNYLDFLRKAGKLNIDVDFVARKFGNIFEDLLTFTLEINAEEHVDSRVMKTNFHDFISNASMLHRAFHIIYGTVPSEIVIYIDFYYCPPEFKTVNYWEFLLHYNQAIKMLKIVFTNCKGDDDDDDPILDTSLCDNCRVLQKTLQIDHTSMRYCDFILQKDYPKPDVVYFEIRSEHDNPTTWLKGDHPVIFKCDSKITFDKQVSLVERSKAREIIYRGQISTEFSDEQYFVIFKEREYCRRLNYKMIQQTMNEYVSLPPSPCVPNSDAKISQVSQQNTKVIERNSKGEQNSKVQQNPNAGDDLKVAKHNLKVIEIGGDHLNPENGKKNSNPEEKESVSEYQGKKVGNQEVITVETESSKIQDDCNTEEIVDSEQKLEDLETLSTSSSSSFLVISKSPDPNAKEAENFKNFSFESQLDFNDKKVKNKISGSRYGESSKSLDDFNGLKTKENEMFLVNREAEKIDKECPATTCENFDSENQSFLLKHNLFLNNEIRRLRGLLNCSVEENSKLKSKISQIQGICSDFFEKE